MIHRWGTKDPTEKVETRSRNVPLNSIALAVMKEQHRRVPHSPADKVFPRAGETTAGFGWSRHRRRQRSRSTHGTASGTRSAAGSRWSEGANGIRAGCLSQHAPEHAPNGHALRAPMRRISAKVLILFGFNGAPGEIRTPGLLICSSRGTGNQQLSRV